jgi:two-component system sensor histidine kinase UhpB
MLLGGVIAILMARDSIERELQASFSLAVEMIESSSQEITLHPIQWRQILAALEHARHINVSFIDTEGNATTLIGSTEPEQASLVPAWFTFLVDSHSHSASYVISLSNGITQHIRITTDPSDEVAEAWSESKAYFISIAGMILLIYILINLVFHSAFKAVRTIMHGLKTVESGDYSSSLPRFHISEFDAIGEQINHLSSSLAEAHANNQALARHTLKIQEKERQTLSQELHDEMGQSLTAIKAMSVALKQPHSDQNTITDSIIEICNHLSGVVRSMMRTLHPLSLGELGLGATLKDLTQEWQRRHHAIEINLDYDEQLESLSEDVAIHFYRIIQECLTNIVKHAKADQVHIRLEYHSHAEPATVLIVVEDNGQGGSLEGLGFGIRSMRERVQSLDGQFDYSSETGRGVTITVHIPINEDTFV